MLPVPLNSSKMMSSMRAPVSTSAVAMMVSEPPSSMLRAAPKNRFGFCSALRVEAARQHLARRGGYGVVGARQPRDRVEQDDDVAGRARPAVWPSRSPSRPPARGAAPARRTSSEMTSPSTERCMSVTSSGRSSISSTIRKHLGVVLGDRLRDALQQHRLAGARRRDDQAALPLADGRHQVHDAPERFSATVSSCRCSCG